MVYFPVSRFFFFLKKQHYTLCMWLEGDGFLQVLQLVGGNLGEGRMKFSSGN